MSISGHVGDEYLEARKREKQQEREEKAKRQRNTTPMVVDISKTPGWNRPSPPPQFTNCDPLIIRLNGLELMIRKILGEINASLQAIDANLQCIVNRLEPQQQQQ